MNESGSVKPPLPMVTTVTGQTKPNWKRRENPLFTKWGKEIDPRAVLPEYPRPNLVRKEWKNLNGLWQYAVRPANEQTPTNWNGFILVPFPIESSLSGIGMPVDANQRLWYQRIFTIPEEWQKYSRLLLHFGAVDWETAVYLNGICVGKHRGGFTPFSFDITGAVKEGAEQELIVSVWDPTDQGFQPRGKQVKHPNGIWYTAVTGIWQTVWIEPVPEVSISRLHFTPVLDDEMVNIHAYLHGFLNSEIQLKIEIFENEKKVGEKQGQWRKPMNIRLDHPRLWSPDDPFLYDVKASIIRMGNVIDSVESYFGMRKISIEQDEKDITRIFLNDRPFFQFGLLDQGYWPDGIYTAPSEEAMLYDIEVTRQFGFNMIRKHVKIEPSRWYYWCDKMGVLVWQDMPSGGGFIGEDDPDIKRIAQSSKAYQEEFKEIIDHLYNHPSVVMWVIFNEGWGQFDTERITNWVKKNDPTRLTNNASGWADRKVGDIIDYHSYPHSGSPIPEEARGAVLGEFGGLGLPLDGHTWQDKSNWGYVNFSDKEELAKAYHELISEIESLIRNPGLSGAVYTQTTDVETEVNGILTYDRAVIKLPLKEIRERHLNLYNGTV